MDTDAVTPRRLAELGLNDWRAVGGALQTRFDTGDFVTGAELVTRIAAAAEEQNHHPDLDLRYQGLYVRLLSHDTGAITARDLRLAQTISRLAEELNVAADPHGVSQVCVGLDAADHEAIRPFWIAVLGMTPGGDDNELVDPHGRLPILWFQPTEPHREPRQRFHLDVLVPVDAAGPRIEAALAAGGTLVERRDLWTVLADAEGNRACVCYETERPG